MAWMIIFIHGAIPHNHQQEHSGECKSVYHCCHESDHTGVQQIPDVAQLDESHSGDQHHFICHFTTGPFHSLDSDSQFIAESEVKIGQITVDKSDFTNNYSGPALSTRQETPDNLRGPPQLMG
jgi:hypothetical protein